MWSDAPLRPEQIIDGTPRARSWDLHRARRSGVTMNYWDCTAGRFHWTFAGDEMVQILEGEVHVTDEDGRITTLGAGDTAHFEAGTTLLWEVPEYVRKLAFHRNPQTLTDRLMAKAGRASGSQRAIAAAAAVAVPVVALV